MKRQELAAQAERLYVNEACEYKEIAAKLGINERTARTWSKKLGWPEKRQQFLRSRESLKIEAQEFLRYLMRDIMESIKAGEPVSQTKTSIFTRLCYIVLPPADFREPKAEAEPKQTDKQAALDPAQIILEALELDR